MNSEQVPTELQLTVMANFTDMVQLQSHHGLVITSIKIWDEITFITHFAGQVITNSCLDASFLHDDKRAPGQYFGFKELMNGRK